MTIEEHLKAILLSSDVADLGNSFSLLLDEAPNWPITVSLVEDDDAGDDGEDWPFKPGDIRYDVCDGVPGQRSTSEAFITFLEAAERAIELQE